MKRTEYIKALIERALKYIPKLPEVANFTKEDSWTFSVELKDEDGIYEAVARYNPTRNETHEDGFALIVIVIGTGRWFFRAFREDDDEYVVYVGPTNRELPTPWYEGRSIHSTGAATGTCTSCKKRCSTVQQAYWGGTVIDGVARCEECRELPCSAVQSALDVPPFSPKLVPSHEPLEP